MRTLTVAAAVMLAALAPASAQTLRTTLGEEPDALDPLVSRAGIALSVMTTLCSRLVTQDKDANFQPELATSWTWSPDGLSLTLKLRPDALFHDGGKVDAAAVKYNLDRSRLNPESVRKADVEAITDVVAVDDTTVLIRLKEPSVHLISKLADRVGLMISPKQAEALGNRFASAPMCSGPYKFVERVAQDRIVLERFPAHWDKAAYHFDRIIFRTIGDPQVRAAQLAAGEVDLIDRVDPADIPAIEKNPRLKLAAADGSGYQSLIFNLSDNEWGKQPIGRDPRVREAFDISIDRKVLNDVVFGGAYTAGNQFAAPSSSWYNKSIPVPAANPAKAKEILRAAGYTQRIPVTMMLPNRPTTVRAAELIQAMTAEAGFDVKLAVVEFAAELAESNKLQYNIRGPVGPQNSGDPDALSFMSLHSRGNTNTGKYGNPAMDKVLEASRQTADDKKRHELFFEAAKINAEDRAVLYLWHAKNLWAHSTKLKGFEPTFDSFHRLRGVTLEN